IYIRVPFELPGAADVDLLKLKVRYDDGFAAFINGRPVAAGNAPQPPQWDSVAPRSHTAREFETFDIFEHAGAIGPGTNVLAIQGLNQAATNSDLFILPEMEAVDVKSIRSSEILYFPVPTPGAPNGPGLPEKTPRPTVSVQGGTFAEAVQVELSTDLAGAEVRYTLDGTVPTEGSTLYAEPIAVTAPTRLTARVFKQGLMPGIPERETYIILHPELLDWSSNIPVAICVTFGRPIGSNCGGGPYTPGYMVMLVPGQDGRLTLLDEPVLATRAAFRKRGSSTCNNAKFAFNVEIWDGEGREKNVDVLDFPRESDYIMYAPNNFDRALMRNPIAYWMSREVGPWAARTEFAECYFHMGAGPVRKQSYFGVFNFMEKNKRHQEKVDIARLGARDNQEPEVTGGYLFRRDRVGPDEQTITAGGYGPHVCVYPKLPTQAQKAYATAAINKAIASLSPNIGSQEDNPLIDFTEWLDHHILNWYPKNVDAFRLSGYFYKDRDGPLAMGPVWDYDRTMGCSDDDRAKTPEGWNNDSAGDGWTRYFEAGGLGSWYSVLFRNQPPTTNTPWNLAYKARWRELRREKLRTDKIVGKIEEWGARLDEAAARNFVRWPEHRPRFGGFQGEVDHLKNWLATRADWIDSQFLESPRFSPDDGLVEKGTQVTITISVPATIYYTLDGTTDPRGAGAKPAASAIAYTSPITIEENTRVLTRALYSDGVWSSLVEAKYLVEIPRLMVTEIMYNPRPPTPEEDPQGQFTAAKMEYIEIANVGTKDVPLQGGVDGVRFVKGVTFKFKGSPIQVLKPNDHVVVARDPAAIAARYKDAGILVAGPFQGTLSDTGEAVNLIGAFDEVIFEFNYSSSWYPETNGQGYSLVNADPQVPPEGLGQAARWRASSAVDGSPGRPDVGPVPGLQRPGDTDGDGKLSVTDAIRILRSLFQGTQDWPCGGSADSPATKLLLDWDANGEINLTDALSSLNYLFRTGPAHAGGVSCIRVEGCPEACGG
ncbi:MAG: CotH kinase family protein, partial [Planctomycetes bacterium]|nr:CotH kinase family protein [Planctomycetota bacterium]